MKTHHSPRGKRMAVCLLAITFAAANVYTGHAIITRSDDSVSRSLGKGFNHGLISISKLGMGLSVMHYEMASNPKSAAVAAGTLPIVHEIAMTDDELSLLQRWNRSLAISSRKGFVTGCKVEIYGL